MRPMDPVLQRRIEAAAILLAAVAAYGRLDFSWGVFAACFFLPDLSMLFYWVNPRVGGAIYNMAHFFLFPVAIGAYGVVGDVAVAQQTALIWGAHVAFDRALGWGLKTAQSFCHTDMGLKELAIPNKVLGPNPEGA